MLWYLLACVALAIGILIAPTLIPKHRPTRISTRCHGWRCRNRADIREDAWPWRTWCSSCHVRRLRKQGEEL